MFKKIQESINIFIAKSPKKAVLVGIMLFNAVFITIAAAIIAGLSQYLSGLKACGFWESVYYTITMILDAGCIDNVITDVGKAGAFAAILCVAVIILGMIFFSGAVIGYITNIISDFIDSKQNGKNKLNLSNHIVMINWNSGAAEIINEFLYAGKAVKVVVFVPDHKDEIDEEIRNRLDTTLIKERQRVYEAASPMAFFERRRYLRKNLLKDKITFIVREGDVAAARDLDDICISKAKTVIILDNESASNQDQGNTQTVKTLIQVSEISKGNRNQTILVEVRDDWTEDLVSRIMDFKGEEGKERIIPISSKKLLGKTNAQIAIMPELNRVYDTLFSNKGPHFVSQNLSSNHTIGNAQEWIEKRLTQNCTSIPLMVTETDQGRQGCFMTVSQDDLELSKESFAVKSTVDLKKNRTIRKRSIVVLGHNSNMTALMAGFDALREKYRLKDGKEGLNLVMVDDDDSLKGYEYYKDYPFADTFAADIYDDAAINRKVTELTDSEGEEATVLILSDDAVENENIDANVLTYLIYIQGRIRDLEQHNPEFKRENLDVVAEILNPKNEDIVKNYGADQVVIGSRFVSRVISQISMDTAGYEFYAKLFSANGVHHNRKTITIAAAEDFFEKIPPKCSASELIRMVFAAGEENQKTMMLGYCRNEEEYVFFGGDQREIEVELRPDDRLILFG